MMRGSAEETQAEARPALPRMRNLRGQGDAPEAPAPRAGVMVARDTQREEREARAAMTGPILERRSGETSLSDTPSE
jgi:hypothetical protein